MRVRAHVFVSGRVQGVFYRSMTRHEANRLNVKGWVQNLLDGRVEAVFEGELKDVEKMIAYCKKGTRYARVNTVKVSWEKYISEFTGFSII
jgi:acylphosphatase